MTPDETITALQRIAAERGTDPRRALDQLSQVKASLGTGQRIDLK